MFYSYLENKIASRLVYSIRHFIVKQYYYVLVVLKSRLKTASVIISHHGEPMITRHPEK